MSVVPLFFLSCEREDCISTNTNQLKIEVKKEEGGEANIMYIDSIKAIGNDSVFYKSTSMQIFRFPLNPSSEMTEIVFYHAYYLYDTISKTPLQVELKEEKHFVDTLMLSYKRTQKVISEECGVQQRYSQLQIEKTTFNGGKGTKVINAVLEIDLGNKNNTNIEIYN